MLCIPLFAQIRPIVIADQQTRKPLGRASLEWPDGSGRISDEQGKISLNAPSGSAVISSVGYRPAVVQFPVSGDTIFLEPLNLFLEPVEVTALRAGDL